MIDATLKTFKILIVDDMVSNIDILEGLLEEWGCTQFQSTTDSRQTINLFKSFKPDLILLDLMMPHLSGFEVMDELKTLIRPDEYLPILVLSADITTETKLQALAGGAKDFLSKPFIFSEVQLRINNLLKTRQLHLQLEQQNQILEEKVKERTLDLEEANDKLTIANKQLEVLDKAKTNFLSLISHEIRTPLSNILGFTGLLKYKVESPELFGYLQFLEKSAMRLETFSYKALLITELRTRKRIIMRQNVSLDDLVDTSKKVLLEKIEAKNISVLLQKDAPIDEIRGDRELLQACFDQLIDNSINFSNKTDVITIKVFSEIEFTVCEFIDNGAGFTTELLNNPFKIFGHGFQHIDENNGLSLALIKLIMDNHDGNIEISNNPIKGATIKLSFSNQQ